jgi:hypothetical protein
MALPLPVDFNLFGAGIFRQGIGRRGLTAIADGVKKHESLTRQNCPISHLYSVSTKSTLLIQTTRQLRQPIILGIASLPGALVRTRTNRQLMIHNSAPGRHPTRQRLVNRPGRGTQVPQSRSKGLSAHSARIFRKTLITHTTLITHVFRTTPPCPSRGAFNPPRRTAGAFCAFCALFGFFAAASLSAGSASTKRDSAKNSTDLTTLRKAKGHARLPVPPAHPCCVQKNG